jgi:CheY-like chemotaxis protein
VFAGNHGQISQQETGAVRQMPEFSQAGEIDSPAPFGDAGAAGGSDEAGQPAVRRRVLIVDDEPDVRETLAEILESDGYLIDLAENGRVALEHLRDHEYSIVLCDLRMAEMDGIAFYRHLKEVAPALAARLILVTGDILNDAIHAFLADNQVTCIEKPFFPKEVRRLVAETLDRK